ncbi:MAG: metallophosphoesterase [Candidatus Nanohaloarchaea archaeon]
MIVLSDIHANRPALDAVLADADGDTFLFAGDLIGYYPFPNAVVETARDREFVGVRGNHDEALVTGSTFGFRGSAVQGINHTTENITDENRAYIEDLPYTYRETVDGADIMVVHGSPRSPVEQYVHAAEVDAAFLDRQEIDVDVLVMGHTHVPFAKQAGDTLVLNPGSVGQPRDGDERASYATLDLQTRDAEIRRVPYDIDETAAVVREEGLPERLAERLYQGR